MTKKPTYEELERKVKELEKEAVQHKEEKDALRLFSHSVDSSIDGIAMGNAENRITYVNETFARMFGYSREELVGKEIAFIYSEDQIQKLEEALKTTLEGGWTGELIGKKKDGELIPIAVSSSRVVDDKGNVIAQMASHRDITERKQAEESLRESKEKLVGIIASVSDHMSMMDEEHNIVWANDVAKRLFGSDIIGKKCYSTYHMFNEVCQPCIVEKTFADGKVHEHETEVIGADGKKMIFWCKASVAAWHEDGRPKLVVEISRDITIRKRTEKALRENMEKYRSIIEGIEELL